MGNRLTSNQKKEYAKELYTNNARITLAEIAAKVGLTEETIARWIKKEGLEKLRRIQLASREDQLHNLYRQLAALNTHIDDKPPGEQFPDSKQADVLSKLACAIKGLEGEVNLAALLETGKGLASSARFWCSQMRTVCATPSSVTAKSLAVSP